MSILLTNPMTNALLIVGGILLFFLFGIIYTYKGIIENIIERIDAIEKKLGLDE